MISEPNRTAIVSGELEATPIQSLGIKGRGVVFLTESTCVRYITRASRFLSKDAQAFAAVVEAASATHRIPFRGHVIIEKAPVCSKARQWLADRNITLETLYSND